LKPSQQLVIVSRLVRELEARGSWGGETHIQKAVFFLKELGGVPLDFEYILYLHGPFSFPLREELIRMRAKGLVERVLRPYPYGPSYRATTEAEELENQFPNTLGRYENAISYVSDLVGDKSAGELEKQATALYLIRQQQKDSASQGAELHDLKPHIPPEDAVEAVEEMITIIEASPAAAHT
jgi:uncharacterized protein YwgA